MLSICPVPGAELSPLENVLIKKAQLDRLIKGCGCRVVDLLRGNRVLPVIVGEVVIIAYSLENVSLNSYIYAGDLSVLLMYCIVQ